MFYKRVYSSICGLSENAVTGCGQRVGMYVIPARVWKTYTLGILHQQVIGYLIAIKYTEAFVIKASASKAIAVQDTRMRCQAGQNRGQGITFRPVKKLGQHWPILLILQILAAWLC